MLNLKLSYYKASNGLSNKITSKQLQTRFFDSRLGTSVMQRPLYCPAGSLPKLHQRIEKSYYSQICTKQVEFFFKL